MDLLQAMQDRHSVRRYEEKPIPAQVREKLDAAAAEFGEKGGLRLVTVYDEPECFNGFMSKYGHFEGVSNYIAVLGKKAPDLDERAGYWGEMLVLAAQALGLNTCWAALTHGKSKAQAEKGEKEVILISLGYGKTQGHPRKSKTAAEVSDVTAAAPEWYRKGVAAALNAPTAMNQQKFRFTREGTAVSARTAGIGPCVKIDLGIVKCHFALAAGEENFRWE